MFNLKTYFKFLGKNKLYTFVNVFGLSVSLMFVILIANYTLSEFTADNFQENADQIYVLSNEEYAGTAYRVGEKLRSRYPEIEKTCGVITPFDNGTVKVLDNNVSAGAIAVDSTFLDMFSFKLLQGDKNNVLKTKNDVLISEKFARKIFGNNDPLGNSIVIQDTIVYTVNGVVEDFKNSMFKSTDIIMRVENMEYFNSGTISEGMNNAGATTMFIQTVKGSDINSKAQEVVEYMKTFFWIYKNGIYEKAIFIPMRDMYFDDKAQWDWNSNDKTMLTILVLVGVLILLFAVINYINLTVAQTGFRAKEMATRRLFGVSRTGVIGKMIFESSFLCFIAFLVGYLLAFALEPYASSLINKDVMLSENLSVAGVSISVVFIILLGAISGIIPAFVISRFQPIDVVKGTFAFKSKMTFSKVFITIQSVITIMLIACSLTIYKQVEYMINYDYGYNHKAIIDISSSAVSDEELRTKLNTLSSVKSVGFTRGTPFDRGNNYTMKVIGVEKDISFQMLISDSATVKMLGIEFLKDNMLADSGYWINQTGLDKLGATDEIESFKTSYDQEYKIAGTIKEFSVGDLVSRWSDGGKSPLMMKISENVTSPWSILVEVQGDLVKGYRDVKAAYEELSDGIEFPGQYMDAQIERSYESQRRIQMIMIVFSIIAIIISSLGLLAISSYFIQQRSREIAVRKVFGSTRLEVLILVIWRFMSLTVIAFIIASPIVWKVMDMWLSDFPQRIDMTIWILLAAGLFNVVIAFLTVYWQSSQVANTNPTKAISGC